MQNNNVLHWVDPQSDMAITDGSNSTTGDQKRSQISDICSVCDGRCGQGLGLVLRDGNVVLITKCRHHLAKAGVIENRIRSRRIVDNTKKKEKN